MLRFSEVGQSRRYMMKGGRLEVNAVGKLLCLLLGHDFGIFYDGSTGYDYGIIQCCRCSQRRFVQLFGNLVCYYTAIGVG